MNKLLIQNNMSMRKLIFSFVFFSMVLCAGAQTNVVKTNPLGLAFGNFNVTYEKVLKL